MTEAIYYLQTNGEKLVVGRSSFPNIVDNSVKVFKPEKKKSRRDKFKHANLLARTILEARSHGVSNTDINKAVELGKVIGIFQGKDRIYKSKH